MISHLCLFRSSHHNLTQCMFCLPNRQCAHSVVPRWVHRALYMYTQLACLGSWGRWQQLSVSKHLIFVACAVHTLPMLRSACILHQFKWRLFWHVSMVVEKCLYIRCILHWILFTNIVFIVCIYPVWKIKMNNGLLYAFLLWTVLFALFCTFAYQICQLLKKHSKT